MTCEILRAWPFGVTTLIPKKTGIDHRRPTKFTLFGRPLNIYRNGFIITVGPNKVDTAEQFENKNTNPA